MPLYLISPNLWSNIIGNLAETLSVRGTKQLGTDIEYLITLSAQCREWAVCDRAGSFAKDINGELIENPQGTDG